VLPEKHSFQAQPCSWLPLEVPAISLEGHFG